MLGIRTLSGFVLAGAILLGPCMESLGQTDATQLAARFKAPPAEARPWVYWFWLNGNITREGITADLEAMARVGIGGVLIMEVDQGAPVGPVGFATPEWRALFKFACEEAARLGLQINMNDDAGWCGSGGPWITPELSMQKLVWTETPVQGPGRFDGVVPAPDAVAGFYRDVAVLAVPVPEREAAGGEPLRIEDIGDKAAYGMRPFSAPAARPATPTGAAIAQDRILDVTSQMGPGGRLAWEAPAGAWVLMRFGHTSTGAVNAPAPISGQGLECDKLSREGAEANFNGFMAHLVDDVGSLAGPTLVSMHIDSWEVGSQNWTAKMREEFLRLRGYDPLPFLPVLSGRVVDSIEVSERFLWDLRQTISDLLVENYAGHTRELANQHGLRLSIEAYGEPADDMAYAGRADEPMCEFWSYRPYGAADTCAVMASAAHVYNKPILGAEAFTADSNERWLEYPGSIKAMGDWAFCEGINRFVFHRYALQPWADRRPGMSMGPWGLHYERTQTWWEQSRPWHEYLARCQYVLQRGQFVADICYLAPEGSPQHFVPPDAMAPGNPPRRGGYDFDACPPEVILHHSRVEDGRLVLSDGVRYRLLVLPPGDTMTPALLRRVKELADAGLTVLGDPPIKSPSLSGYPACDAEVTELSRSLWGADGTGAGTVVRGKSADRALAEMGVPPDFETDAVGGPESLRYIHRSLGRDQIYFVSNGGTEPVSVTCTFRAAGARPELWDAENGRIEPAPMYEESAGRTRIPLWLGAADSVFVIFRAGSGGGDHAVGLSRDGEPVLPPAPPPIKIVVQRATYGPPGDAARTKDVTGAVQALADHGVRSFQVALLARDGDPAYGVVKTLRVEYTADGEARVASATDPQTMRLPTVRHALIVTRAVYGVPGDQARTRDVAARVQRLADAGEYEFAVRDMAEGDDPAFMVVKTLRVEYELDGAMLVQSATDSETIRLLVPRPRPARLSVDGENRTLLEAAEPGHYTVRWASGTDSTITVAPGPDPLELTGPWEVSFAPGWGAPSSITLPELASWSVQDDPGVRYYSGTGVYHKTFRMASGALGVGKRLWLDLGRVAVIAQVTLNGRDLGTLWRSPYRADVTDALRPGENTLEIRVTNLWPNRMIGDERLAEDSDRHPDGTLRDWPDWLQTAQPNPAGRFTFTSWRLWGADAPLLESGLLGPVRLETTTFVSVR